MGRSGPEDAVDGDQRVWALGSRDTRKAGTGERGQSPQRLGISLALNFLSTIVLFVQWNALHITRVWGLNNAQDLDKDGSRKRGAESRGEKKSLKQSGNKADGRGSQQKGVEEICND